MEIERRNREKGVFFSSKRMTERHKAKQKERELIYDIYY